MNTTKRRETTTRLLRWLGGAPFLAIFASCATLGPDSVSVVLPVGDPQLGYEAFRSFNCSACHQVQGHPEPTLSRRFGQAPELVRGNSKFSAGDWATAIIAPGHESTFTPDPLEADTDPQEMPQFHDQMTVGELMDLVAFLDRSPNG